MAGFPDDPWSPRPVMPSAEGQIHAVIRRCYTHSGQRPEKVLVACDIMRDLKIEIDAQCRFPRSGHKTLMIDGVPIEETRRLAPGTSVAWLPGEG